MFFRRKKEEKIDFNKKFGSFAFYFSIPAALTVSLLFVISTMNTLQQVGFEPEVWALAAHALISSWAVFGGTRESRFRTLVHELKHAILVTLTGNKLKEIKVGKSEGYVAYNVNEEAIHLEPFVVLAPYFFPLFSSPIFLLALYMGSTYRLGVIWILAFALGTDLALAKGEIHRHQSDLNRIFGGYFTTRSFIIAVNFLWTSLCVMWISGGPKAFAQFGLLVERIAHQVVLDQPV